jgi:hypothetical protein
MTPANAGSKTALITWNVVATMLFVACLIWAIMSAVNASDLQKKLTQLDSQYKDVVPASQLAGETVKSLQALRNADSGRSEDFPSNMPVIDVAAKQTSLLVTAIDGSRSPTVASDKAALTALNNAITAAAAAHKDAIKAQNANAVQAIKELSAYAASLESRVAAAEKARDDAVAKSTEAIKAREGIQGTADASIAQATDAAKSADASATKIADEQKAIVQETLEQAKADQADQQTKAGDLQLQINSYLREIATLKTDKERLIAQIGRADIGQVMRNPDGRIIRAGEIRDRVTIDLGKGDGILAGMTFEVYDSAGVPRVSDSTDADKQLKGKASVEVLRVNQGNSECRVVRVSPGQAIVQGDVIANLIYDRNVRFNFKTYGKFNLDYKGQPTDRDNEIVQRLISMWGGTVVDKISTDTDFVVLGAEPVVPTYTQDELAADPLKEREVQNKQAELDAYLEIRQKAQELTIPILNQTRFLYMIGYYEEAAR